MTELPLSVRLVHLQSWWVTAELLRRHPELTVVETQPGGGQYDCLTIWGPNQNPHIDLNRKGRIHVHSALSDRFDRHASSIELPIEWFAEAELADRRAVPLFLEAATGLPAPAHTLPTTSKTLVFRMIYHLLLFSLNEPAGWDVRNAQLGANRIHAYQFHEYAPNFLSAHSAARSKSSDDFWAVIRDHRCLAIIQEDGRLHLPHSAPVTLMDLYDEASRDILAASFTVRQLITAAG